MQGKSHVLTKNEQEIMNLLWKENRPLSRSDIINLSTDRSWKASSIHILLNQLLEKGAIQVYGFIKTGKNYGRTFSPSFSEEEYFVLQFQNSRCYQQSKGASLVDFVSAFIQSEEIDSDIIDSLEELLNKKRKELK
ncbi:BlaI/MecI/CopY family transcriptional regulator [Anaerotignum sp.]|uniref:BlaI/MecI/CopY family transcriptional regulator n=1 Tax=Anaerotignum sp. TaxID=2039241 RepID=UPI0028A05CE8|nr:BlaI/MecI/CopY family transcriptional regulator [Anaerotignum sp.]